MIKSFLIKKLTKDFWQRITVFGRDEFYLFLMLLFFFLGYKEFGIRMFFGFIVAYILVVILRLIYFKERPIKYESKTFLDRIEASSFPSMHTVRFSMLTTLVYFNFLGNYFLFLLFLILLILISYSRIKLKRHYISDVIVGIILGFILGYILSFYFYINVYFL